jgi:hypothetical protein
MWCVTLFVVQEDERVGHVRCNCKYCLMLSPVLVGRKKNHVQVSYSVFRLPCFIILYLVYYQ